MPRTSFSNGLSEQIEEEANDNEIISKLKLVGKDGKGLFMIDKELAARVFTPPATSKRVKHKNREIIKKEVKE